VAGALELGIGQQRVLGRDHVHREAEQALERRVGRHEAARHVVQDRAERRLVEERARQVAAAPGGSAPGWNA
jgi:hypothetical protein